MKKLLTLLLLATFFVSCSSDDDNNESLILTSLSIESVDKDLYIGDEYQLKITSEPKAIKTSECTWKSSNNDVVSVSQSGLVTLKDKGNATISVSYNGVSNSILLKIYDTLFGYKFGSSIEEITPNVKISNDFAYNWASIDFNPPMRAFLFEENKLMSIWECYDSRTPFTNNIKTIDSSLGFEFATKDTIIQIQEDAIIQEITLIKPDSVKLKVGNNNLLIRNGFIPIKGYNHPMYIIEYSQAN